MAFSLTQRPDAFSAAYLPMIYKGTSTRMPNSRAGESDAGGTLISPTLNGTFGTTRRGERILVYANLQDAAPQLKVGAYVKFENAGQYNGVHRINEIVQGASDFTSVSQFYVDTLVNQETGAPINNQITALTTPNSVTVSKYYNNYSAVLDLYISGNFVARLRKKVDVNDEFVFDISTIVQEYLGSDLYTLDSTTLSVDSTDLSKEVHVQTAQEFDRIKDDGTTELLVYSFTDDSANSFRAVNSVIPYVRMNDFVIDSVAYDLTTDYVKDDTEESQKFLTNQPSKVRIGRYDNYALSYIVGNTKINGSAPLSSASLDLELYVRTFDSQGNIIAVSTPTIKSDTLSDLQGTYAALCGPANLDSLITSETVEYDIAVFIGSYNLMELKRFVIDDTCYKDEYRFEWVNKLGGLDAFTFTGKYTKTSDIEKETFKRTLSDVRTIPERQLTTLTVMSEDIHTVNSGIVSKDERDWLEELLESPEVYLIKSGYRLPVQVDTKFGFEKLAEDSYNVTLEFRLAYDKQTQRN